MSITIKGLRSEGSPKDPAFDRLIVHREIPSKMVRDVPKAEEVEALDQKTAELDQTTVAAVAALYNDGDTYSEIAEKTGIPAGSVGRYVNEGEAQGLIKERRSKTAGWPRRSSTNLEVAEAEAEPEDSEGLEAEDDGHDNHQTPDPIRDRVNQVGQLLEFCQRSVIAREKLKEAYGGDVPERLVRAIVDDIEDRIKGLAGQLAS